MATIAGTNPLYIWLSKHDYLTGTASSDVIYGYDGNDTMQGAGGNDTLYGSSGNDYLVGGAGADVIHGGGGTDWASYEGSRGGVDILLPYRGGPSYASGGDAEGDVLIGIENLRGSAYSDALRGDEGANRIEGMNGNDFLLGFEGADTLDGGNGNDSMFGGEGADLLLGGWGSDTARYDSSPGGVTVLLDGLASTPGVHGFGGDAEGDTLVSIENLIGSTHNDVLMGNAAANRLEGGFGNDTLGGGGGTTSSTAVAART